MTTFQTFSKLVHDRYNKLAAHPLFVVGEDNRAFEARYLAAFPEGTNPIFKTNTEHDCTCCKQFIRNLGNLIAIVDGKRQSIWGVEGAPYPYDVVAKAMDKFVLALPINSAFYTTEPSYGNESTSQRLTDGTIKRWNHFHGRVPAWSFTQDAGTKRGEYDANVQVFRRGLAELTTEALTTVLGLIEDKALYRGEEHLRAVQRFMALKVAYHKSQDKEAFVWDKASDSFSRFRNTAIGTLVTDLSAGVPLEDAVRMFEAKVAPQNYKRTTALITPSMVSAAMKTIQELGLEQTLERRFAKISDVSVNNVLWVNNATQRKMRGAVENMLLDAATSVAPKGLEPERISIDTFMSNVLPKAKHIEMLVSGTHLSNFVTLTAPVHGSEGKLFKWANDFGWSYDGNVTDSIKEKVKAAGGNVTNAKLRVSLAWFNLDDLDIHVFEPNGNRIYFGNRQGKLDVDMNVSCPVRNPVENVSWTSVQDGVYQVQINQFSRRETRDIGCVVEIESGGQLVQLSHKGALGAFTPVVNFTVKNGLVIDIKPGKGVTGGGISQEKWGVKTETFVKVNTLMYSPNYWDDNASGNKHWLFMLDGCQNDVPARGIYNEFLSPGLEKHRKVFEVLGNKALCQPTDDQLSGLGFSSTRNDQVTVKVDGRPFKIFF